MYRAGMHTPPSAFLDIKKVIIVHQLLIANRCSKFRARFRPGRSPERIKQKEEIAEMTRSLIKRARCFSAEPNKYTVTGKHKSAYLFLERERVPANYASSPTT